MEMSTIIVLAIAIFIIIYRARTWNEVNVINDEPEIVEEVVEYKVEETTKSSSKPKKSEKTASKPYTKTLKADLVKNQLLSQAVNNSIGDQWVYEIKSQPKSGVTTLITLVPSFTKGDRAVGMIYEKSKSGVLIIKSFDVKMQAKEQFKISTSFSKSLTIKKEEMVSQVVDADQFFVSDEKSVAVSDVVLTLK